MAIAAGVHPKTSTGALPLLFLKEFPSWFAGFGFAAIAIGALVPAAIMSIAAANLFTRNIYREFFRPDASTTEEAKVAKVVSLIVKLGALLFIIGLPAQQAINFQLLGGIWILQTLPPVILGLYTRWLHRYELVIGWLAGMVWGTMMAAEQGYKSSVFALHFGSVTIPAYAAVWALLLNLIVSMVLTWVFNALSFGNGEDRTRATDYVEDTAPSITV